MNYILIFVIFLFHAVCNADPVTMVPSQPSRHPLVSDNTAAIDYQNNNSTHTVYTPNPITFSTQYKPYRHHSSAPRYDLNHMSTEQLAWYFSAHGYTEEDILKLPMLYLNPAYLAIAKQLPRYPEFVEKYYKKYRTYKGLYKLWEKANFRYHSGMKKQFARLHQECEATRRAKQAREHRESEGRAQAQSNLAAYCAKLNALAQDELMLDAVPYQHLHARNQALSHIKTTAVDRVIQKYTVARDTITFAREYGITEHDLITLHGNAYEHQLHTEFLEQLAEARSVATSYALQPKNILIDAVCHSAAIGMEANRLQQPGMATTWANFAWKVLDIIEGVGEGLVLFAENTADMLLHPMHTLQLTVHGLGMLTGLVARTCAHTAGTALYWHELMEHGDGLMMAQEMDQVAYKVKAFGSYCIEKAASLEARDIAKYGMVIAADILLTHKMFVFGGTLCTRATPIIRDAMAHVSTHITAMGKTITNALEAAHAKSPVLQTAEGILTKATEELNKVGGTAGELFKGTRLALETVHAQYMAQLEIELGALRLSFDNKVKGFAEFTNKFLKIEYKHILGIENLAWDRKGFLDTLKGFHHDFMNTIKNSGVLEFVDQTMYEHGFYKATVLYEGNKIKNAATFFPAEWPREKVIEKICEAYGNFIKEGAKNFTKKGGKYAVDGTIKEGVEIRMFITEKGKLLTAYPLLPPLL